MWASRITKIYLDAGEQFSTHVATEHSTAGNLSDPTFRLMIREVEISLHDNPQIMPKGPRVMLIGKRVRTNGSLTQNDVRAQAELDKLSPSLAARISELMEPLP
jgi:hypothetical protein